MIPSNPNPPMKKSEVERFRSEMARRMRRDFTPQELHRIEGANETYKTIMNRNGGKNPLFGF